MVKNYFHNVIRLRKGKTSLSQVYWLIVILNKNKTSSQKQVEQLGFFKQGKEKLFSINYQRLAYYLNKGFKLKNSIKKYIYWHSIVFNKYYKLNKLDKLKKYYKLLFNKKSIKNNIKRFKKIDGLKCYKKYSEIAAKLVEQEIKKKEKKNELIMQAKLAKYKKYNKGLFYKNRKLFYEKFYRDNTVEEPSKNVHINTKKINLKDVFSY